MAQLEPELEYLFRHALVQDAAYDSLLKADRRRLHRAVAEILERTYPERLDTLAATLAHHYKAAGDDQKALHYFTLAAERALANYANQEAADFFWAALALAPQQQEEIRLRIGLGGALLNLDQHEEAITAYQGGIEIALALSDTDSAARMYSGVSSARFRLGQVEQALEVCQLGLTRLKDALASPGLARLTHNVAEQSIRLGRKEGSMEVAHRALEMARSIGDKPTEIHALITLAHEISGAESIDMLQMAAELADEAGLLNEARRAHWYLGWHLGNRQLEYRRAIEHCQRVAELDLHMGRPNSYFSALQLIMEMSMVIGDSNTASLLREELLMHVGTLPPTSYSALLINSTLAWVMGLQGDWPTARQMLRSCLEISRQANEVQLRGYNLNSLGQLAYWWDDWDEAADCMDQLQHLPEVEHDARVSMCSLGVIVKAHQGRFDEARAWLAELEHAQNFAHAQAQHFLASAFFAAAEQRWDKAFTHYRAVADLYHAHELRAFHAPILYLWADAYAARNQPGDIRQTLALLQEARREFEAMRAAQWVARIDERIRALAGETA